MLAYADVCWLLTYADVCWRMLGDVPDSLLARRVALLARMEASKLFVETLAGDEC